MFLLFFTFLDLVASLAQRIIKTQLNLYGFHKRRLVLTGTEQRRKKVFNFSEVRYRLRCFRSLIPLFYNIDSIIFIFIVAHNPSRAVSKLYDAVGDGVIS